MIWKEAEVEEEMREEEFFFFFYRKSEGVAQEAPIVFILTQAQDSKLCRGNTLIKVAGQGPPLFFNTLNLGPHP